MAVICPNCKSENPYDSKFCKECGAPLKASKKAPVTKTFQTPLKEINKETVIAASTQYLTK